MHAFIAIVIAISASGIDENLSSMNVWPKALLDNSRVSIDVSARGMHAGSRDWSMQAIGLDVHKVVSTLRGDVGTLVFQPYILRIDNPPFVPSLFDDAHDWALQWRIANFNYTGIGHGRFNIRLGHFETPFGLEQVIQTNGTLRQINSPTGLKADWGTSVNGSFPQFEYEFAYMLGSGNEWDTDSTGVMVGRIGLPRDRYWWLGASYLDGKFQTSGAATKRDRMGMDFGLRLPYGFTVLGEYVVGHEAREDFRHSMAELSWYNANESTQWFGQWQERRSVSGGGRQDEQSFSVGMRYEPNVNWSLSMMVRNNFRTSFAKRDSQFATQIRYRT